MPCARDRGQVAGAALDEAVRQPGETSGFDMLRRDAVISGRAHLRAWKCCGQPAHQIAVEGATATDDQGARGSATAVSQGHGDAARRQFRECRLDVLRPLRALTEAALEPGVAESLPTRAFRCRAGKVGIAQQLGE
jgi:hypothetical protein